MSGRARLIVAALIALFAVISYFGKTSVNPVTGETQRVALTPRAGGRPRPEGRAGDGGADGRPVAERQGARAGPARRRQAGARERCRRRAPYKFSFHVLADPPHGQCLRPARRADLHHRGPAAAAAHRRRARRGAGPRDRPRHRAPFLRAPRQAAAHAGPDQRGGRRQRRLQRARRSPRWRAA